MDAQQFLQLQGTIADSIEKNVNGKIKLMDIRLTDYIREDNEYKERLTKETDAWRKGADEKLAIVASVQGFGKVSSYILGVIITVGGATAFIMSLLNWLKK